MLKFVLVAIPAAFLLVACSGGTGTCANTLGVPMGLCDGGLNGNNTGPVR